MVDEPWISFFQQDGTPLHNTEDFPFCVEQDTNPFPHVVITDIVIVPSNANRPILGNPSPENAPMKICQPGLYGAKTLSILIRSRPRSDFIS